MADTTFSAGTVVASAWLNDVNRQTYDLPDSTSAAKGDALVALKRVETGASAITLHQWHEAQAYNVREFGAVGDGTTDDTTAIQAAIDAAELKAVGSGGACVYFPATTSYYKLTSPLTVQKSGITIRGDGVGSQIYNATGDALRCGDNVTNMPDIHIQSMNVQANGANSICIKGQKTTNLRISNCTIVNYHASSGDGIRLTGSFCATIVNNTFGSIMGYAIHASSNANAMLIAGNRIDGGGASATCGIYIDGVGASITGNTIETWTTCVNLNTGRGVSFTGNYFETYTTGILIDGASARAVDISGNYFAAGGSTVVSIKISAGIGFRIGPNLYIGTHTGGAPIELTTGPGDVEIEGNLQQHDDNYIVKWPINHLALRQHLTRDRSVDDTYGYLAAITHTGTVSETTLKTYTGKKEHWGTGTRIDVRVAGRITGTAGQKDIRLKLAGTTIGTVTEVAGATDDWIIEAHIDVASATVGQAVVKAWQGAAVEVGDVVQGGGVTLALSTTDPTITVTGQLGNTADSIIVTHWSIELRN